MSKIYGAFWCPCIYESVFGLMSLHTTKRGAYKAIREKLYDMWVEQRECEIKYGIYSDYPPAWGEAWEIRELKVEEQYEKRGKEI